MQTGAKPDPQASFGEVLRRFRTAAGLTQEELAERAEMSVRGLRYLELGRRQPYRQTMQRLVTALGLSPEEAAGLTTAARPAPAAFPFQARGAAGRLPLSPGPLVGREREVGLVADLLAREDVRLLTLTGPGGVGKTRLAVEVAANLKPAFTSGVIWVPLAALTDPNLVISAIAQALRLMDTATVPLHEALTLSLRNQKILLLLDNFEHLAPAAVLVADLVSACPGLTVLATSRAALRLRSEHEFSVSPLRPPDARQPSVYSLAANPAVDLFLRRAQAVRSDFALTAANAATVAGICRRLEGLPLGIELAAARVRVLTPKAMLGRLEHRLSVLTGGGDDVPARQRTMRETIAWSYELLNHAEQRLFRRLAVFAGGCSLTTVGAMFEATGDDRVEVLDRVEALQRSSLLQLEEAEAEDPRFRMLETIREYAVEQLQASGEEEELRQWHATHYLEFAEEAARRFYSPDTALSLGRLEREHDNLRAAVRWHIDRQNVDAGLRLGGALWWFWYVRGYSTEGQAQLAALLALPKPAGDGVPRAAVLLGAGQLAQTQGDYKKARALLDESIALYRAKADERGTADALLAAGFVARVQEDHITARALLEEALELSRGIGYPFITAAALHHLGMMQTDVQGDYTAARKLLEESLTLYRALGFPRFIALLLLALADVGIAEGDHVSADASLRQSLMTMTLVGEKLGIYEALDTFAHLSATEGQAERTVRLAGAATRLRSADGTYSWPVKERCRERWLASARAALDEEAFKRAWDEGQAMTREQAIDYALRR